MVGKRESDHSSPEARKKLNVSKERNKRVISVKGQISKLTHVIHTSPESIFIEICDSPSTWVIMVIIPDQIIKWINRIVIGNVFTISDLVLCKFENQILSGMNIVECYKTTDSSVLQAVVTAIDESRLYDTSKKGIVVKADQELGIYHLDNSLILILSPLQCVARVPIPKEGDALTVYNAHVLATKSGRFLILCCWSYLSVNKRKPSEVLGVDPFLALSPVLNLMMKTGRNYKNILWVEKCQRYLKDSFSDSFLQKANIEEDVNTFRSRMLHNILESVISKNPIVKEEILLEILQSPHKCSPLNQEAISFSFMNITEIYQMQEKLSSNSDPFWNYSCEPSKRQVILVGQVSYSAPKHQAILQDAGGYTECSFKRGHCHQNPLKLYETFVLVWKFNCVVEKFEWEEKDVPQNLDLKYIILGVEDLTVLFPQQNAEQSIANTDIDFLAHLPNARSECLLSVKRSHLEEFYSQLIMVQHKSSVMIIGPSKAASSMTMVTLIGETKLWSESYNELCHHGTDPFFIKFPTPLLVAHHFMEVNKIYEIRLPISCGSNFFHLDNRKIENSLVPLREYVPSVKLVSLPTGSEIFAVNSPIPAYISTVDCYSVHEAVTNAPDKKFFSIICFISNRLHEVAKFTREIISCGVFRFGLPGKRVANLFVFDDPPWKQSPLSVSTLLVWTNWNNLKYPLAAIVPGAKVVIHCINKIVKKDCTYFRTSVLSSIELLELPASSTDLNEQSSKNWGSRCLIRDIVDKNVCGWVSVSMMTMIGLSLFAVCGSCGHQFLHGQCSYIGCHSTDEPTIKSQAIIFVSYEDGVINILVPSKHVAGFFQFPEVVWNLMVKLAKESGQLCYPGPKTQVETCRENLNLMVFYGFCHTNAFKRRRVHMFCRKIRPRTTGKTYPTTLYCIDFKEIENFRSVL